MTVFDTDMRIFETRDHIPDEGSIYGEHITKLRAVMHNLLRSINLLRDKIKAENGTDPVDHCLARIKSDESMREKCRRKGLPETTESALFALHDAIGIRIVCRFLNDVYMMRDALAELPNLEIIREKDYIRHAKSNGYRILWNCSCARFQWIHGRRLNITCATRSTCLKMTTSSPAN